MNNVIYFDIGISKCLNFTKHVAGIATMIKRTGADCGLSTLMILRYHVIWVNSTTITEALVGDF